jgi:hypothetical protein
MKPDSPSARRTYRRTPRALSFYPVPTRSRRDGWTIQRQAAFIGSLVETGSAMGACAAVGMSRKSAYQLRARPRAESFAAAWDAALGAPVRKVTVTDCEMVAHVGLVHLHFFRGRMVGSHQAADLSAVGRLVARVARAAGDAL